MTTSIELTAEQRDALYEATLYRLSGSGDLWMMIKAERFTEADRIGQELSDVLYLVRDGLGWGEGSGESVVLTSPPDALRRAVSRLCHIALELEASELAERIEARREMDEAKERNHEIVAICRRVLAQLDLLETNRSK